MRQRSGEHMHELERRGLVVAEQQLRAIEAYRPKRSFRGEIVYFLHTRHGYPGLQDRRFLWREHASQGLRLFMVGGIHGRFSEQPARQRIATALDDLLNPADEPGLSQDPAIRGLAVEPYRRRHLGLSLEEKDGLEHVVLASGRALPLATPEQRPAGVTGRLEQMTRARGRMWLAGVVDAHFCTSGDLRIVVFARGRPLHVAIPGEEGSEAFEFTCMVDLLLATREDSLRVLAVTSDLAVELEGSPVEISQYPSATPPSSIKPELVSEAQPIPIEKD